MAKVEDLTLEQLRDFVRKMNASFNLEADMFCCPDYDDYEKIHRWLKELGLEPEQEEDDE
jgi:hypothetical protein